MTVKDFILRNKDRLNAEDAEWKALLDHDCNIIVDFKPKEDFTIGEIKGIGYIINTMQGNTYFAGELDDIRNAYPFFDF